MIKGSHNTMSYLTPRKWWMRLVAPWARCQSKTIDEQWQRILYDKTSAMADGVL